MTANEFDEVIGWIEIRWPNLRWTSITVAALFSDVERFDSVDVWSAVHNLYEKGSDFAPNPSIIVATTLEERRLNDERKRLAMPISIDPGRMLWPEYAIATYGEPISMWEAAERQHAVEADCVGPKCKVHA